MAMMDTMSAGPVLGNEDGRMMADPDQDNDQDLVPCPHCQGTGMMPADQAMNPDMQEDTEQGMPGEAPPRSPVTGRTAAEMQPIRDYKANRPAHLQNQPFDEEQIAASGQRVRERMRRGGGYGG